MRPTVFLGRREGVGFVFGTLPVKSCSTRLGLSLPEMERKKESGVLNWADFFILNLFLGPIVDSIDSRVSSWLGRVCGYLWRCLMAAKEWVTECI